MAKAERLFCVILIILFLSKTQFAIASNTDNYPVIKGASYDYSDELGWGFGGLRGIHYTSEGEKFIRPVDTEYVGLNEEKKEEIQMNPDAWSKGWVRVSVLPNLRYAERTIEQLREINAESGLAFGNEFTPESLMAFSSYFILNVRVVNCDELGIYPKQTLVFSGSPSLSGEEKLKASKQPDHWYMEVLIENRGRNEVALDEAIKKAEVVADVGIYTDGFRWFKNHSITLAGCDREVYFQDDGIAFYAEKYREASLNDVAFSTYWAQDTLPYEVVQDVIQSPEKYHLIELAVYMDKEMDRGVCMITPMLANVENTWFFFNDEDGYPYSYNDRWENGKKTMVHGFFVLIREDENKKLDIKTYLNQLHLQLAFSTEAAGQMYWDGGRDGWWGYVGMRFVKEIDMSLIKPVNEATDEEYPWVSAPGYY